MKRMGKSLSVMAACVCASLLFVACGRGGKSGNYEELLAQGDITELIGCDAEDFYAKVNDGLMTTLGVEGCYVWEDPESGEIYAAGTSDSAMNVKGYVPGGSFEAYAKELLTDGWEYVGEIYWFSSEGEDDGNILDAAIFDKENEELVLSLVWEGDEDTVYSIEYVDTKREKKLEKSVYGEAGEEPAFVAMTRTVEEAE